MSGQPLRAELATLLSMVYVACVDGHLDPSEVAELRETITDLELETSTEALLRLWLTEGPVAPHRLAEMIVDPSARRAALFRAYLAAHADGTVVPGESRALESLARAFAIADPERIEISKAAADALVRGVAPGRPMAHSIRVALGEARAG